MSATARSWSATLILLAAGVVGGPTGGPAAPVPRRPPAPHGIVLFTWQHHQVLFLNEGGQVTKRYDVPKLAGKGWWPAAVSPDARRLAVVEDPFIPNAPHSTHRLRLIPLVSDVPAAEFPQETPANGYFVWSADGKTLTGTRHIFEGPFGMGSHTRNIHLDLGSGTWGDLPLATERHADKSYPVTKHTMADRSPDGKWLLTVVEHGTFQRQLFLVSRDGGTCRPLTDDKSNVGTARFSPDGETVMFSRFEHGARPPLSGWPGMAHCLYTLKLAGGEPTRIVRLEVPGHRVDSLAFAWRPDGKRVVCVHKKDDLPGLHRGPDRMVICDPDGRNPSVVKVSPSLPYFALHGWR
jgi:hypothetical protein